ncbi:biotin-dependent carboxyltransferase family protein [Seonamhaeicola sediminis]|uniref:Biotin-dependent carboxyltransferase family protein n=1 Tax=Seonamhaeicola sediminis TaxID=2528206 RepID=A0A562YDU4_9FLAO|nr:biotin-dependent carboxyltransferase family protein [Seonamhaeicola sediminis]TWO32760.1 biotin-dependent carboxyltransferase family protein [Seonamhaeicola sediminis]
MIKVLSPGIYSSIQDFGRFKFQEYGVPISGIMDKKAASFANAIIGNSKNLPVLEITMVGPKLKFDCNTSICISGADITPKLNNTFVSNNKAISVDKGDVLSFGQLKKGVRTYLAVSGGFKTERIMQSYSMYQGLTSKFKIEKNDVLKIESENLTTENQYASIKVNDEYLNLKTIEVFKGPEFDNLTEYQKDCLLNQDFTISKDNNRMAYQLNETIENNLEPIITSLVLPGTVQLTPSGRLIVLMRDCQTTGGYPRVLQLKEFSINVMAQKFTGQHIGFKLICKN